MADVPADLPEVTDGLLAELRTREKFGLASIVGSSEVAAIRARARASSTRAMACRMSWLDSPANLTSPSSCGSLKSRHHSVGIDVAGCVVAGDLNACGC